MKRTLLLLGVALSLGGCTTMTQGEYNNLQAMVSGSPSTKRDVIADCIKNLNAQPLHERKSDARAFNISLTHFSQTYCTRLWNGVSSGRITYDDYAKLKSAGADNSKVIRIMQGR